MRLAGALALALALGGCNGDPDPFPYAIESLVVLPTYMQPFDRLGAQIAGDQITHALRDRTSFRVVPASSALRVLNEPSGQALYERFRSQAITMGAVSPQLSLPLAQRLGAAGLLFPRLSLSLNGQARGDISLSITVFESTTGFRVWTANRRRGFAGAPGEPAFVKAVGVMVDEIIETMPRPSGEVE